MRRHRARLLAIAIVSFLGVGLALPAHADEPTAPPPASPPPRAALRLDVDKAKVDLAGHRLEITPSNDLVRVTIKVVGDSGAVLALDEKALASHPARTPLVVRWTPSSDEAAARIDVAGYDADGSSYTVTLTPLSVTIPHEEVGFATDSAVIADAERPKLEASYAKVLELLAIHAEIQGVRLFVAGHTDTVGDAGYNLRLSRQRAQAIARWFRQRGLTLPIGWQGFGETALLVKTADNVDEPRNRRVDYFLSVAEPTVKTSGARATWNAVP